MWKQKLVMFKYLTLLSACFEKNCSDPSSSGSYHFAADGRKNQGERSAFSLLGLKSRSWAIMCIWLIASFLYAVAIAFSCPSGEWLIPDGDVSDVCNSLYAGTCSRVLCKAISIWFACSDRHAFILNVLLELQMMPWDQTMPWFESVLFLKSYLLP